MKYDCIVVGAGHAGCETAVACSKRGKNTLLITTNFKNAATLPCNPSIGGSAKGIVVREIDALGGIMGKIADKNLLQMKMLNSAKGPAVRSLRAQIDKVTYPKEMQKYLTELENLTILEDTVENLIVENRKCVGVILENETKINSSVVILTTGTYMKPDILVYNTRTRIGPNGEKPCLFLSDNLKKLGLDLLRLKTGTPARIKKESIDYSKVSLEDGDKTNYTFSFNNEVFYDFNKQIPCYLTYTTCETQKIIEENLTKSSMYGGLDDLASVGPRYCPSIEDKIVRFNDKKRHQLFLEPESVYYDDIYVQGFSTSMPKDVQLKMLKSVTGLENVEVIKYGYAIEYDAVNPKEISKSLEVKSIENLFLAGQINGTSGYEEAACQGLIAGINACNKIENKKALILDRDEAYIGVLIDDLVTKGVMDPYRLLTSRAEYRLLLRHDNADIRLRQHGYENGLINKNVYLKFLDKVKKIEELTKILINIELSPNKENNLIMKEIGTTSLSNKTNLYNLLKRYEVKIDHLKSFIKKEYDNEVLEQVWINSKYEGYINKAKKEAKSMKKYEEIIIPIDIDYNKIPNLASEAKQKLTNIKPTNIGFASRISGVNPSDISILTVYLKKEYYGKKYF